MSRSAPMAPAYLLGAIFSVELVLLRHYPEPRTAEQIAEELQAERYRWPLPNRSGRAYRVRATGDPTTERVRRVCKMTGNRTDIQTVSRDRPATYSLWPWAVESVREIADRRMKQ